MGRFEQAVSQLELTDAEITVHEEAQRDFMVYQKLIVETEDCTSIVLV